MSANNTLANTNREIKGVCGQILSGDLESLDIIVPDESIRLCREILNA